MPTPPLPLLHALLDALDIPIHPSTLSSTSPSLLLLTLETILQTKLSISVTLRDCSSSEARPHSSRRWTATEEGRTDSKELELVKCTLGVLSEQLGKDLTVVNPLRVVSGFEEELGVMIMGLTVLARRKGVHIAIPSNSQVWNWDEDEDENIEHAWNGEGRSPGLIWPLEPDVSLSPRLDDVQAADGAPGGTGWDICAKPRQAGGGGSMLFELPQSKTTPSHHAHRYFKEAESHTLVNEESVAAGIAYETPLPINRIQAISSHLQAKPARDEEYHYHIGDALQDPDAPHSMEDYEGHEEQATDQKLYDYLLRDSPARWKASSSTGHSSRTVLDDIIEEFGLAP